jgi:hypothetical protein
VNTEEVRQRLLAIHDLASARLCNPLDGESVIRDLREIERISRETYAALAPDTDTEPPTPRNT